MPDELNPGDWFVPAPRVEAGWLVCRRLEPSDAAAIYQVITASSDHLRPWMPWVEGYTFETARAFVDRGAAHPDAAAVSDAPYLVCDRSGQLLGACGLHARLGSGALEIGYWVDVRHTRRGVATLAAAALTELAMNTPGVGVVEIHHDRANRASRAVPARLGYELVATVEDEPAAPAEEGIEMQWRMTEAMWPTSAAHALLNSARASSP